MSTKSGCQLSRSEHGFILVSVILSVTLLLSAATAFAWFARVQVKRVETRIFIVQARSAAEIVCSLAAKKIAEDKNGYDSAVEPLYSSISQMKTDIGDFTVTYKIEPLDDKIPVRGLFLPDGVTMRSEYEAGWTRIWDYLKKSELAAIVADFMDSDEKQKLGGSERENSINRLVSDLSELKLIPEIEDGVLWGTEKIPGGFGRYLGIYGKEKINVYVARPEVIAILDSRIDLSQARSIVTARIISPIKSLDDLKKLPAFPDAVVTKLANVLGFESTYFRVVMKVKNNAGKERNYRIILERAGSSCKISRWEE